MNTFTFCFTDWPAFFKGISRFVQLIVVADLAYSNPNSKRGFLGYKIRLLVWATQSLRGTHFTPKEAVCLSSLLYLYSQGLCLGTAYSLRIGQLLTASVSWRGRQQTFIQPRKAVVDTFQTWLHKQPAICERDSFARHSTLKHRIKIKCEFCPLAVWFQTCTIYGQFYEMCVMTSSWEGHNGQLLHNLQGSTRNRHMSSAQTDFYETVYLSAKIL